jgi:hypothetical protein
MKNTYLIIINKRTGYDDTEDYCYDEVEKSGLTKKEAIDFVDSYELTAYENYIFMVKGII